MSPQEAFDAMVSVVGNCGRECGREVFTAGIELHQKCDSPADAFFEEVWSQASKRLWQMIGDAMLSAGLTDPETIETLQWIAFEEFDGEFDRMNAAWMGEGGTA